MNNADMPAMPLTGDAYTDINGTANCQGSIQDGMGLTKREHFAVLAPDAMPQWFFSVWSEADDNKNKDYIWHRKGILDIPDQRGLTEKGEVAIYFAWRTFYANGLLTELNKGE
jgi:hypothetical protein